MTLGLSIDAAQFADAIAWVCRALPSRPTNPQLGGVLLEAADGALRASVYNYEVSAAITVPAAITVEGTTLVSGRLLAAILKAVGRKTVLTMTELGTVVKVTAGTVTFTLPMMDSRSYPQLPDLPPDAGSLNAQAFADAIATAATAAGDDTSGHTAITGIYLQVETPGQLTIVGTDRYRLTRQRLPWTLDTTSGRSLLPDHILVPARALAGMKITDTEQVFIGHRGGVFSIHASNRQTTLRLLDGQFPKYDQLIPARYNAVAIIGRAELADAIGRAMVVTLRDPRIIQMTFEPGKLVVTAGDLPGGDGLGGSSVEELAVGYSGESLLITFNAHYLLDGLNAVGSEYVQIGFTANSRPAILQAVDGAVPPGGPGPFDGLDTDFLYLLMPYSPSKR